MAVVDMGTATVVAEVVEALVGRNLIFAWAVGESPAAQATATQQTSHG